MTPQNLIVENYQGSESTASSTECVALSEHTQVEPANGSILACVLFTSCVVQRWVSGHWVDHATVIGSGMAIMPGDARVRFLWKSVPEGIALTLGVDATRIRMERIADALSHAPVMQLQEDALATSFARALVIAKGLEASSEAAAHIADLLVTRISELGHAKLLSEQTVARALPSWRLRRVAIYVQENLDKEVRLSDMAEASGLSPMYFAAQFKAATGMRPHDYLLLQRIEQAKMLLTKPRTSILEIALSVGFQTQSHFATVFKRLEKKTPNHWRRVAKRERAFTSFDAMAAMS